MIFENSDRLVREFLARDYFSGAALGITDGEGTLVERYYGRCAFDASSEPVDEASLFDLASLTKIVSTTMIALRFLDRGLLRLDDTVGDFFPEEVAAAEEADVQTRFGTKTQATTDAANGTPVGSPRAAITIRDLLTHTSGIPAHFLLEEEQREGRSIPATILRHPLSYERGSRVEYSCMGFILLGEILQKISGTPLAELYEAEVRAPLMLGRCVYRPLELPDHDPRNILRTRDLATGRVLTGEVHDENARYLGGVSPNAGLFSDLPSLLAYARMLLNDGRTPAGDPYLSPRVLELARRNYTPGLAQNRGLGFHLGGRRDSFFGDYVDETAYGHTGFTGTSIVLNPSEKLAVVLLTNKILQPNEPRYSVQRLRALVHNTTFAEASIPRA